MNMLQTAFSLGSSSFDIGTVTDLFLLFIKLLFLIGSLIYIVFSVVVVRQIHVMKNTLITPFSPIIQSIGILHLIMAVGAGLMLLVIL